MVNNIDICDLDWWYEENVLPIKEEVDNFLEQASHPDFVQLQQIADEAYANNQIPKIVHFCFINYKNLDNCYYPILKTWIDHLPDYIFVNWLPEYIEPCNFSEFCLYCKKWAYYTDYCRVVACYNYGGFYMDTDIVVHKSFNSLINLPYIFDFESQIQGDSPEAGVFGVRRYLQYFKDIIDHYHQIDIGHYKHIYDEYKDVDSVNRVPEIVEIFMKDLIIYTIWNTVRDKNGYVFYRNCTDNIEDNLEFFKEHPYTNDTKHLLFNNGKILSQTDTNYPNRCHFLLRQNILENENPECAYSSHQTLSMHSKNPIFNHYEMCFVVPVLKELTQNDINKIHQLITFNLIYIHIITDSLDVIESCKNMFNGQIFITYIPEIYKFQDVNQLITSEWLYDRYISFKYLIVIKPDSKIYNAYYISFVKKRILSYLEYDWIGGFNGINIRKTLTCLDICHKYPNNENINDTQYFQKYIDISKCTNMYMENKNLDRYENVTFI